MDADINYKNFYDYICDIDGKKPTSLNLHNVINSIFSGTSFLYGKCTWHEMTTSMKKNDANGRRTHSVDVVHKNDTFSKCGYVKSDDVNIILVCNLCQKTTNEHIVQSGWSILNHINKHILIDNKFDLRDILFFTWITEFTHN